MFYLLFFKNLNNNLPDKPFHRLAEVKRQAIQFVGIRGDGFKKDKVELAAKY